MGGNAKAGMARAGVWGWMGRVVPGGVRSPAGQRGEFRGGNSQGKGGGRPICASDLPLQPWPCPWGQEWFCGTSHYLLLGTKQHFT